MLETPKPYLEAPLYRYRGYALEESAIVAAAGIIRERDGYEALIKFADELGMDQDDLFKLLRPWGSNRIPRKALKEQIVPFLRLLIWEGHTSFQIGRMVGYKGTPKAVRSRTANLFVSIGLSKKNARMNIQKTNPRVQALLDELEDLNQRNRAPGTRFSFEKNHRTIKVIEELLKRTEISQEEIASMLGCPATSLWGIVLRKKRKESGIAPKQ